MTAREYLGQLPDLGKRIEYLQEEIQLRRARLTSTTVQITGERVQTSTGGDRFADMIAALADKELQFEEMLETYEEMRRERIQRIMSLEKQIQVDVLYLHYAKGLQLKAIAQRQHYAYGYICKVHSLALAAFDKKYNDL